MTIADLERFAPKFVINPDNQCWEWISSINEDGYGTFWLNGGSKGAHRVLYRATKGEVPSGLVLDHEVCDNRRCVNPSHLVPKTDWENRQRSRWYGSKTHCKRGHFKTPDNVYTRSSGKQECRECRRLEMKRYYAAMTYEERAAAGKKGGQISRKPRK